MKNLPIMGHQIKVASAGLLLVSIAFCILPIYIVRIKAVNKAYPFITVFTAGLQLATILVDLTTHMVSHEHSHGVHSHGSDPHSHSTKLMSSYNHNGNHDNHDDHKHDDHGHSHDTHEHDLRPFMLIGITFIL